MTGGESLGLPQSLGLPAAPFLYPLTDRRRGGAPHPELVRALVTAGVGILQLREKELADLPLLRAAEESVEAARSRHAIVIVNDRIDIALASGAQGVHLGEDDLEARAARRLAPPGFLIGTSTHDVEAALRASESPVDYVALGPIFASPTKPGRPPLGAEAVARVRARTARTIVAIGGIDAARMREVVEAGAHGIAVIAAVMAPGEVTTRATALVAALADVARARA